MLACQYGFLSGNSYLHLQEGYEPASEHWNVGIALRAWSIREFLGEGIREYDFLAGVGRHKTDWGAHVKESRQLVVASPSSRNLLYCRGPEWEERARESVKRLVPERVLALRKARLEQRSAAPRRGGTALIRKAAARCYLQLGAPAVASFVHDRYQLTRRSNGRPGRLALTKRRQPSGRILYYHRVNDDNDPFFPSMPVRVFEQQMRFVAAHYKVVSLTQLVEHLVDPVGDRGCDHACCALAATLGHVEHDRESGSEQDAEGQRGQHRPGGVHGTTITTGRGPIGRDVAAGR